MRMSLFCGFGAGAGGGCAGAVLGEGGGSDSGVAVAIRSGVGVGVNNDSSLRGGARDGSCIGLGVSSRFTPKKGTR